MKLDHSPLRRQRQMDRDDVLAALLHLYVETARVRRDCWLPSDCRNLDFALADAARTLQNFGLLREVTNG